MKGMGWIGIVLIAGGVLMIWAGFQNVNPLDVLRSVLNNEPVPGSADDGTAEPGAGDTLTDMDGDGDVDMDDKAAMKKAYQAGKA